MSNNIFRVYNDFQSRSFPISSTGGILPDPLTLNTINVDTLTVNQELNAPVAPVATTPVGPCGSLLIDSVCKVLYISDGMNWNIVSNPTLDVKQTVRVRATVLPAFVAAGMGVGKTLTGAVNGALPAIDTINLVLNDRLIVDIASPDVNNGIYVVTDLGSGTTPWILTRSTDADTDKEVTQGMFAFVAEGATSGSRGFIVATQDPIIVDVTPIRWEQFTGVGDNLGNHIATMNLEMSSFDIDNVDHIYGTGVSGTSLDPTYSFTGDATSGMYAPVVGEVRISALGNDIGTFDGTGTRRSLILQDGTLAEPSLTFASNPATGIFMTGDQMVGIGANGSEVTRIGDGGAGLQFLSASNTAADPVYSFFGNSGTGMFRLITGQVGISLGGAEALRVDNTRSVSIGSAADADSSSLVDITSTTKGVLHPRMTTAERNLIALPANSLMIFNTTDNEHQFNSGTPGVPVWSSMVADNLGNHTATMDLNMNSFNVIATDHYYGAINAEGDPTYSFTGSTTSGMFSPGGGSLGFSALGTERFRVAGSSVISYVQIRANNGSMGTPSYSFDSDQDTGIFWPGANSMAFSTSGNTRATITNTNLTLSASTSLQFTETGGGADTITIQAPAAIAAPYTLTLPVDDGNANEVLQTNGSGVLSWASNGAVSLTADAPNAGPAVPSAGTISVLGATSSDYASSGIQTSVDGTTNELYVENKRYVSAFIVDPSTTVGTRGEYGGVTAVADALAAASAGDTVYLRPGTYNENISVPPGVSLVGLSGPGPNDQVIIAGTINMGVGAVVGQGCVIQNIRGSTGGAVGIEMLQGGIMRFYDCEFVHTGTVLRNQGSVGVADGDIEMYRCILTSSGGSAVVSDSLANGSFYFKNCTLTSLGTTFNQSTAKSATFEECNIVNTGVAPTLGLSAGSVECQGCTLDAPGNSAIELTGGGATALITHSNLDVGVANATDNAGGTTMTYGALLFTGTGSTLAGAGTYIPLDLAGGDNLGDHIATMALNMNSFNVTGADHYYGAGNAAGDPTFSFTGDTNTGMFSPAADQIGFSAGATDAARITAQGIRSVPFGSAGSPSFSWATDANTGIYRSAADEVSVTTGGTVVLTMNNTPQLLTVDGSVGSPSYSFINADSLGMYTDTTNLLFSTGGAQPNFSITSTSVRVEPSGSAAVPSYTFRTDTDTGIYNPLANVMGFSSQGTEVCQVAGGAATPQLRAVNGTATNPVYSFINDTGTGIYVTTAPPPSQLFASLGGTNVGRFDATSGITSMVSGTATTTAIGVGGTSTTGLSFVGGNLAILGGGTQTLTVGNNTLGFYNGTAPIAQPLGGGGASGWVGVASNNVQDLDTFTGGVGASTYTIGDIVAALKNLGLIAM